MRSSVLACVFLALASVQFVSSAIPAASSQFPHQGYVSDLADSYIGGCWIYNRRWVVASYQYEYRTPANTVVTVNTNALGRGIRHTIQRIVNHPEADVATHENYLSLIELEGAFFWSDNVRPFPVFDGYVMPGAISTAVGFNQFLTEDREFDKSFISIRTISNEECLERVAPENRHIVTEQMICTEPTPGCTGDPGNSLIAMGVIIGTKTFASDCNVYPGVYTRMSFFTEWVEEVAGESGF